MTTLREWIEQKNCFSSSKWLRCYCRGVKGCVRDKPGVGTRTTASDLITTVTCSESVDPPAYFGCPGASTRSTVMPSSVPSAIPSTPPSSSPSIVPSVFPSQGGSGFPTPIDSALVELTIYLDPFPQETSWLIKDADTGFVYRQVPPGSYVNVDHAVENITLPYGKNYLFVLSDTASDGIMGYGHQFELKIVGDGGVELPILQGDGNFGGEVQKSFSVPETVSFPTASPVAPTSSPAPTPLMATVFLTIWFDNWHEETSWKIVDSNDDSVVYKEIPYGYYKYGDSVTERIQLPMGKAYTLIVSDYYSDGISSQGYKLWMEDKTLISADGDFGSERRDTFWIN